MTIYQSIAAIMAEAYSVGKDKVNQQQGFKFRGIDDVMNTFKPLLAKHGVFAVPEVLNMEREDRQTARGTSLLYSILTVRYTFYAADGTSVSAVVIGEGMDSGDKASNKAMAVAFKYALFQTFCIPTEEMAQDDPDRTTPEETRKAPRFKQNKKPTLTEEEIGYDKVMAQARMIIATITDAETATAAIPEILALKHVGDSKKDAGKLFNETTKNLGIVYDANAKCYVAAHTDGEEVA